MSATPLLVGAEDMAFDTVVTNFLTSGEISAGMITSGTIKVDPTGDAADGIEVWLARWRSDSPDRVGLWDETGLYIGNNTGGLPNDLSSSDYVRITNAGLTVYLLGVPQSAITPAGINASAINFGRLPGGMNLVKNSSFELAPFGSVTPTTQDVDGGCRLDRQPAVEHERHQRSRCPQRDRDELLMATTTNFTCNKDARIASSGRHEMGSGTSDGLPYGTYSGYKYRALLGFSINMAGWTSITIGRPLRTSRATKFTSPSGRTRPSSHSASRHRGLRARRPA